MSDFVAAFVCACLFTVWLVAAGVYAMTPPLVFNESEVKTIALFFGVMFALLWPLFIAESRRKR